MALNNNNSNCVCDNSPSDSATTPGVGKTDEDFKQIWEEFHRLRLDGQLCDVVLVAGDTRFRVHRAILAANSPYFRALFTNGMKETDEETIELPGVDPSILEMVLNYMYMRSIVINLDNVFTLLTHADNFFVSGLVEKCSDFLRCNLSSTNCVSILKFAQSYYKSDVEAAAREVVMIPQTLKTVSTDNEIIVWNGLCLVKIWLSKNATKGNSIKVLSAYLLKHFVQVARRSHEFLTVLDADDLCNLISDNALNVKSEDQTFETLVRWIDYSNSTRIQYMPVFLQRMRLGLMSTSYFLEKVSSHPYVVQNFNRCETVIKEAWNVLYYLEKHGSQGLSLNNIYIQPRIPHSVLFALGGWSGGSPIAYIETYDIRAARWYSHPSLEDTAPRAYHGLAALGEVMYIIGGFDGSQYYNNVKCFNARTKVWKDVAPMYTQRCYVSTAVANGLIYACGGYDGRYRLASAERYNSQRNQWSQIESMHERRSDAGADVLHGDIYIAGGFNGEHCLSSVEMYSPSARQWTLITNLNVSRSGVAIISFKDYIYALGGFDGDQRLSSCERYCPITKHWEPVADMLAARSNFAVGVIDNVLFAIGGFNGSFTIPHVECYTSEANEWIVTTDMNINRSALKACVIDDLPNIRDYTYYGHLVDQGNTQTSELFPRNETSMDD